MPSFTGTDRKDRITETIVSPGVLTDPGFPLPSAADDLVEAGRGDDIVKTGAGDDTVTGGRGDDRMRLGHGDDLATWAPGDGSDSILAGAGFDTVRMQGSARGEDVALADGFYDAVLFRDLGFDRLDLRGVERVEIDGVGGGDYVQISDLSYTAIEEVLVAFGPGGGPNEIAFIGTGGADSVSLSRSIGGGILVDALGVQTEITGFDAARDSFIISLGDGDNSVDARVFTGADLVVATSTGNDLGKLGQGDDRWVLLADFGQDTVEGAGGRDTLDLDASIQDDVIAVSGDAAAATVTKGVNRAEVTGFERIEVETASGNDSVDGAGVTGGLRLFLWGGTGDDTMLGGARGDRLHGGWGADSLAGGGGGDRFVFGDGNANGVQEQDRIADFNAAEGDLLDLLGAAWTAEVTAEGVLVTLAADDMDQVLLLGLGSVAELAVVA